MRNDPLGQSRQQQGAPRRKGLFGNVRWLILVGFAIYAVVSWMGSNVSEWVGDCWHASYRRAPADGAAWFNPGCRSRVVRGGSWASSPVQARAAWRSASDSDMTNARVGFRVVRGI